MIDLYSKGREIKVNKIIILFGFAMLLILAVTLLYSCTRKKLITEENLGFTIKPLQEGESISANSLWNAYLANKKTADLAYKDKIIRVTGKVQFFSPRRDKQKNRCYIILEKEPNASTLSRGIQCQFLGNINDIAPTLKTGDEISIRGTCYGKIGNIFLENCAIGDNPLPTPKEADPLLTVHPPKEGDIIEAIELWEAYRKNFSAAHDIYYNRVIQVKGIVRFFGPPRFWRGNTSFIILEADLLNNSLLTGVQCEFEGNVLKDLPGLKKGDEVVIEGTGSSKFGNVFLKKCRVVDP